MIHRAVGALGICVVAAGSLGAQAASGTITGSVRDQDGKIGTHVHLRVDSSQSGSGTDSVGNFRIDGIRPGVHVLRAFGFGYLPVTFPGIRIDSGQVTSLGTVVVPTESPREVWLGCKGLSDSGEHASRCFAGRKIAGPRGAPRGAGIVRDSATWRNLWGPSIGLDSAEGRVYREQNIDWRHEMVVLVSMGGDMFNPLDGDPMTINRIVESVERVEIVLGPDTLQLRKRRESFLDAIKIGTSAVVVPYSSAAWTVRYMAPVTDTIDRVDWQRVAKHAD